VNTLIPAYVVDRYAGSRLVALSSGNVYPLVPVGSGGADETQALTPLSEYANACVARERIFEYQARQHGTQVVLFRLNYAVGLRYGVLVDIARKVQAGTPVDVTMGYLNCIWQGDANDMVLRALDLADTPPRPLNVTGSDVLSVRVLAERLGNLMGRPPVITGEEAATALLSNPATACTALGTPPTPLEVVLRWTAHWVQHDGLSLGKPTHFDVRDGRY
jgi:nucleoside-diphosphate-sugar epimerase